MKNQFLDKHFHFTYHPDILYWRQQGCEDKWYFSKPKVVGEQKKFEKHWNRRCTEIM